MGFAAIFIITSAAWFSVPHGKSTTIPELIRAGKLTAQLDNVPSHNRIYRASLLPSQDATNRDGVEWKLRLETPDGEPVSGAMLVMQAWMPEEPSMSEYRPQVITDGAGSYKLEGLHLDRAGWWNMKLSVTHVGVTDSLAFNLVLP